MRTLSVTVTVSPLATGDPSTCIDTVSTGGLAALGVQLKEKEVPVVRRVGFREAGNSGRSAGVLVYMHELQYMHTHNKTHFMYKELHKKAASEGN